MNPDPLESPTWRAVLVIVAVIVVLLDIFIWRP